MTTEHEYDPATCWTAKQLRDFGFTIPADIPDCGWVPKSSCKIAPTFKHVAPEAGYSFGLVYEVSFTEAFRWVECSVTVEKKV